MTEVAEKKATAPHLLGFLLCALCENSVTSVLTFLFACGDKVSFARREEPVVSDA
jgi:hypothetical protein